MGSRGLKRYRKSVSLEEEPPAETIIDDDEEIKPHKMITLNIYAVLSGSTFELAVWSDELVDNVRRMILERLPGMYRLIYCGYEMKDGDTLIDCDIRDGCQIRAMDSIFKNISKIEG
jgi:hypothetical protein